MSREIFNRFGESLDDLSHGTFYEPDAEIRAKRFVPEFIPVIPAKHIKLRTGVSGNKWTEASRKKMSASMKGNDNNAKLYKFISPTGKIIRFRNLTLFSRNRKLNSKRMFDVLSGKRLSHHGYRKA